jgi:class 3 adenylate cyclase/tetratricopeptide (TPR) repeat protein/predicted Ser/Thr protein kinase
MPGGLELAVGDSIGAYRIEAIAGRGGMGVVYRARQARPERIVAIKVIAPEYVDDSEFRKRFEHESNVAAQIEHPNVIPVYEVGEEGGLLFIAMRFVEGTDLGMLRRRATQIRPEHIGPLVTQIAGALDAAHARGLVHRDIKPGNVLLVGGNPDGHVYLTDFGLTKRLADSRGLTATGAVMGTLDYMAPEQVMGQQVDPRTDVYSLGCVVYELLVGTTPFAHKSEVAKLFAHVNEEVPPLDARALGVGSEVGAVVSRAMVKDPAERFQSAGEFAGALSTALTRTAPKSSGTVAASTTVRADRADASLASPEADVAAPQGRHQVRKTVTVLFAAVTGATSPGARLDAEASQRAVTRYLEVARSCIERHGGTVERLVGDAVMAVFGVPTVREDDALRALRAAAELRGSLEEPNDPVDEADRVSLQLRVGVDSGEVVVGPSGHLTAGDPITTSARLEQAARPGDVLLGEQTRRLASGAIEAQPVRPSAVKGRVEPLSAFRLVRVVEGASAFERRFDAPLVGRSNELARIEESFRDAVASRRSRLVTVLGPPGIGKSRLAEEVAGSLAADASVLSGRCLPYGEGITYWPLVEIFRQAEAEHELDAALDAGAPEEIFWSVRKSLERRARERPLALIFEDIHWAEPTLLDLLEHLVEWTRDAPLLLLCLARPELTDNRRGWSGQLVVLEPLSGAESDELIGELLGDWQLEQDKRARLSELAEGNPLFVEQLLAMLAEGGDPEQIPPTINAVLSARLDALPSEERELIERASVVGLEFEWDALTALAQDRQRPAGARLAALVRKELIRPHEATEDTFRFRHMLIRDAAYERIPEELRSELHERFADWLDDRGEEFEAIVGYHLEQAHDCLVELGPPSARAQALAERAADRLSASGQRAYSLGDIGAAANLIQRAVALLPSGDPRGLTLVPTLGRALYEAGDAPLADSVLSEAVDTARATGQQAIAVDAAVALATMRSNLEGAIMGQEPVWRELEEAIPFYERSADEAGLARALGVAGNLKFWRGEAAAAIADFTRSARHAHNAGERAQEVESIKGLLMAMLLGPTPVAEALERIEELTPVAEQNPRLRVHVLRIRAHLEAMQANFAAARSLIAGAKELATELGLELTLAFIAGQAGPIEMLAGDAPAAERELRPACEALLRMEHWGTLSSFIPRLVDALLSQDRDDDATRLTDLVEPRVARDDLDGQIGCWRVRAKLLARRGGVQEAESLASQAAALARSTDYLDLRGQTQADLAEVLRLADRSKESATALEKAIGLFEQKGNIAAAGNLRGEVGEPAIEVEG